ncbi:MAG: MaoC family dehydratase [Alphaproteobacteria bacterium]|jgi:2-methylfumaryl-CoA hydratase|nr:MaoC family dehydratase [Alphaproteobacteria bacterium]MDP6238838.1 MaoC family dehydratase [Alphaproteobacteria bacterium]MDP7172142.1 MaoC family dehydratase [Alphaproteobacteria bacterium]MDP7232875.1 MaoC family dehydratase [Alphaproteobacteria bacterium]MDP7488076.1 MaoC family dehydratase [Alphaproteobacteria bacterium]|tara:strand:+ start:504 stop:1532 length:1029 start_codon:yes stop_codon:yes gene_type:complete
MSMKSWTGNFFEDFAVGQEIVHATPRTVNTGDVALYTALTGSRFAVTSADSFAQALGLRSAPIDPWLAFHMVFGKSVPDVSFNAVANLGYAEGRFLAPIYPGDTLSVSSTVIGVRENSNGKTGVVYVRTSGTNQARETVMQFARWVMVAKRDPASVAPEPVVPELADHVAVADLLAPTLDMAAYDFAASGEPHRWDDYTVGERIDHRVGITIEEAEHQMATRLYQNTARPHYDAHYAAGTRFGKRLIYGGHVISLARALSFNGLANAFWPVALNGGRHAAPVFAGDTIHAWSEVLAKDPLPGRADLGSLRLRLVVTSNRPCVDFPEEDMVLDLDTTVLLPRG